MQPRFPKKKSTAEKNVADGDFYASPPATGPFFLEAAVDDQVLLSILYSHRLPASAPMRDTADSSGIRARAKSDMVNWTGQRLITG